LLSIDRRCATILHHALPRLPMPLVIVIPLLLKGRAPR
jgi:hypothetical protein